MQFVYNENGWRRIVDNPLAHYNDNLKGIISGEAKFNVQPNVKFTELLYKINKGK